MGMLRAVVAAMALAAIFELAMGVTYNVGQPGGGWDLSTNYTQWVSGKKFQVNDSIVFTYTSSHDVLEVNSAAYSACDASSPISRDASGRTVFQLTAAGKRYFICGIPTHCTQGMKVEIDVAAPASSPPSPSGPKESPTPGSPPAAPSPGSSASSPPPPPRGAATAHSSRGKHALGFGLGMIMMMVVLGL